MRELHYLAARPNVYFAADRVAIPQRISTGAAGGDDDSKISTELAGPHFDHFEVPTQAEGLPTLMK